MMETVYKIFSGTIMITGFIFVMMLIIEYVNVQSRGIWQKSLTRNKWRQYLIAGILGVIQGCLGAFTMVAESKRGFLAVKLVNIVYALIFGLIGYLAGI